jgi:serine protease Do
MPRITTTGVLATTALGVSLSTLVYLTTTSPQPATPALLAPPSGQSAFQLAVRNQVQGAHPDKTMFGSNPSLIADVAEQVAPSVVNIDVARTGKVETSEMAPPPFLQDDFFQKFFGFDMKSVPFQGFRREVVPPMAGNGSGVILNEQGYILTNNHVVASADTLTVTLQDGRKFPATVVGKDRFTDLAVLKINADKLQPAVLGNSDHLRPGEWVIAVGSPLGFDHTVTLGIVSALSRRVPDLNSNVDFIQTDAAINPGNSGGPLVNLRGEVIGINTAISGIGQNIGFAIPVSVVKKVADALVTDGKIVRPWIGLAMSPLTPELAKSLGLAETLEGVVVSQVVPNSPSARAGFRHGDIIQRVDGKKVIKPEAIQELVRAKPLQSTLNVQVLRDGHMVGLAVKTEQLPDVDLKQAYQPR